jgi:DNA invertase Pin-like site-specific DNA recombinase
MPDRMSAISHAIQQLEDVMRAMVSENAILRKQLQGIVEQAGHFFNGQGRLTRSARAARDGAPRKRGRAFKFTDEQAADFRKQVEGGKSAASLAKELRVSLPTMYNTLRRGGWGGRSQRRGRPARGARARDGAPRKRGRAFKFTDEQAVEFRKQIEGGKSAASLAKELKVSLPTMYNTLKRAGWRGRK